MAPVSDAALTTTLRQRRTARGLSQGQLAGRVGVSRQALVAIEAGRQVPSTTLSLQLARALGCSVEDLFALPTPPTLQAALPEAPPTPTTRVALGRIDDRWVAHPVLDPAHPADGVLVGGLDDPHAATVEPLVDPADLIANVLVAGCAPLLGLLAARLGRRHRDARATWLPSASARSLDLLARRHVHLAGLHLADAAHPAVHAALVTAALPGQRATLVHLTRWRQGLVVARGNPLAIRAPADVLRPDVRCVLRDPGSGAQRLLERVLGTLAPGNALRAADHAEVARLVRWGVADVGVAIESAALAEGLDFIPLSEERFDLVVPDARLSDPSVARLLDLIDRPAFRAEAARLPGYDLSTAGHALAVPVA